MVCEEVECLLWPYVQRGIRPSCWPRSIATSCLCTSPFLRDAHGETHGTLSEGLAEVKTVDQLVGHVHFASVLDGADAITGSRMLET